MVSLVVSVTTWIVWAVIGIVAGYMTGRLVNKGRKTALNVIVGIVGAVIGGYAFVACCGDSDNNQIISLLSALAVSGLCLWLSTAILAKNHEEE